MRRAVRESFAVWTSSCCPSLHGLTYVPAFMFLPLSGGLGVRSPRAGPAASQCSLRWLDLGPACALKGKKLSSQGAHALSRCSLGRQHPSDELKPLRQGALHRGNIVGGIVEQRRNRP